MKRIKDENALASDLAFILAYGISTGGWADALGIDTHGDEYDDFWNWAEVLIDSPQGMTLLVQLARYLIQELGAASTKDNRSVDESSEMNANHIPIDPIHATPVSLPPVDTPSIDPNRCWGKLCQEYPGLTKLADKIGEQSSIDSAWAFYCAWRSIRAELRRLLGENADKRYEIACEFLLERLEQRWARNRQRLAAPKHRIKSQVNALIREARGERSPDWPVYERYKRRLKQFNLSADDCQEALADLADALGM